MRRKLAYILCTFGGAGYFPVASGTFASFIAIVALYFVIPSNIIIIIGILFSSMITVFFTPQIEAADGKDPQHIVMDEVAGQWVAFLLIPNPSITILLIGFFLFRFFDISKLLGVNKLQTLKGGWGVLIDDLVAGLYTNILLQILLLSRIVT